MDNDFIVTIAVSQLNKQFNRGIQTACLKLLAKADKLEGVEVVKAEEIKRLLEELGDYERD